MVQAVRCRGSYHMGRLCRSHARASRRCATPCGAGWLPCRLEEPRARPRASCQPRQARAPAAVWGGSARRSCPRRVVSERRASRRRAIAVRAVRVGERCADLEYSVLHDFYELCHVVGLRRAECREVDLLADGDSCRRARSRFAAPPGVQTCVQSRWAAGCGLRAAGGQLTVSLCRTIRRETVPVAAPTPSARLR